ncbi:MAG: HAD-IA family hydrolase [Acidobacteriota bacterium]
MVSAIVFDFDGTLIDASQAICHSFNGALRQRRYAEWPEDSIRRMIGRPLTEMFTEATGCTEAEEIDSLIEAYREHFLPACVPGSRALPGTVDVIEHFSPRIPLAIATSRHSDGAVRILQGLGLMSHFSAIVGLEQVENPKPHPEPVIMALQRIEVRPQEAAMVGDTVDDIQAGKEAGALSIGVTSGAFSRQQLEKAGADFVLERISGLIGLLGGISL